MKKTKLTLIECIETLKKLNEFGFFYIDEIPECLKDYFNNFIVGKTLSTHNGR